MAFQNSFLTHFSSTSIETSIPFSAFINSRVKNVALQCERFKISQRQGCIEVT